MVLLMLQKKVKNFFKEETIGYLSEFVPRSVKVLKSGYSQKNFFADLYAGITVAIIALPLAMALAIASGVGPERGLYTAIIAGFLISALGGTRRQIGGPTGAFVVIVLGIVQQYGYDGLATATFMAGFILLILGFAGFGKLIKFIPYPVTTGFTSGIAVLIATSQVKDFFGLKFKEMPTKFLDKWFVFYDYANTFNLYAILTGVSSLALLIYIRKTHPKIPSSIVVVVLTSSIVSFFNLPVDTVGSIFGNIPNMLPAPSFSWFNLEKAQHLIPEATTIAFLAAIESLLSAVVADGMTADRHDSNTELVGQGFANIFSVIFGGIPATGAIARTAANIKAGAHTPVAGMIHALTLLVFMLLLAPLAGKIPLPCLAAMLIMVAWNMSEFDHFRYLLRAPRSDVIVLLTSFLLTVLVDLTVAVEVGIVMASLLFMKRMSDVSEAVTSAHLFDEDPENVLKSQNDQQVEPRKFPDGVEAYQMTGPFFFGVVDRLKHVLDSIEKTPKVFILRMRSVPVIDATGINALRELYLTCKRQHSVLVLAGVQRQVERSLKNIGLWYDIGTENIVVNTDAAVERAEVIIGMCVVPSRPK